MKICAYRSVHNLRVGHYSDSFGQFSSGLKNSDIVRVFIRLKMNGEIAFGGGGVAAHLAAVRFVSTRIAFTASEARMSTTVAAVTAIGIRFCSAILYYY